MTHIPLQFLTFFADLHAGDELILHKGAGIMTWKPEIVTLDPRGVSFPLPEQVWQAALAPLGDHWQGSLRFYCGPGTDVTGYSWLVSTKTFPVVDTKQGLFMLDRSLTLR